MSRVIPLWAFVACSRINFTLLYFTLLSYLNFFDLIPFNLRTESSRGVNLTSHLELYAHYPIHDVYRNENNPFTLSLILYVTFLSSNIILACTIPPVISLAKRQKWLSKSKFSFNPGCVASMVIIVMNTENL